MGGRDRGAIQLRGSFLTRWPGRRRGWRTHADGGIRKELRIFHAKAQRRKEKLLETRQRFAAFAPLREILL
jgi:hypothetical protein